jgi:DNA-nicking Smr family endonuclease
VLTRFTPKPASIDALRDKTPGLDRNTARALRRGERSPDARIDLHGMTADRAHGALTNFILASRQRGHRCVLVITGKGRRYTAPSTSGFSMEHSEGVLRRDVPRWLREQPLAGAIVGVYKAHQKHGGDGALYVYLRKAR